MGLLASFGDGLVRLVRLGGGMALVATLLLLTPPAVADTIILKNGNKVTGRIIEENAGFVRVNTGVSEVTVPTESIKSIDRGVPLEMLIERGERAITQANAAIAEKDNARAQALLNDALRLLDREMEHIGEPPEPLVQLRERLEAARLETIPNTAGSAKAEELYRRAIRHLDHIENEPAFRLLNEAAQEDPGRADIQFRLAKVAGTIKRETEAAEAYKRVLEIDAEGYYADCAAPYLDLLRQRGRRLVAERRSDEALAVYKELLLLESGKQGEVASFADYLSNVATRKGQREDEVLMAVYRYADANDLVDLAFASISEVQRLNPDHPDVARLVEESRFLSEFKAAIDAGKPDDAARLRANAPASLRDSPRIAERIKRVSGDLGEEIEAQALLKQAEEALAAGEFSRGAELARKLLSTHARSAAATRGAVVLRDCELEAPVKEAIAAAEQHNKDAQYDDAEEVVGTALSARGVEQSRQHARLLELQALLPLEREADRLWLLASAELSQEDFDAARETLGKLASDYKQTKSGAKAQAWLDEYAARLGREANRKRLVDDSFFSFVDANLWRAAAMPASASGRGVPELNSAAKEIAWDMFHKVVDHDAQAQKDQRSPLVHIAAPILGGGLVLLALLWWLAKPGSGQYIEVEEAVEGEEILEKPQTCRACGQMMPDRALTCPACGTSRKLSDVELERRDDEKRQSNFDPWDVRVKAATNNRFDEYFQKARDLSQTSDVQAAIEQCKNALHEDPHRKDAYLLLAELHDRIGREDEATKCYREVLLIDPSEVTVRQKLGSKLELSEKPIRLGALGIVLPLALWWSLFWIAFAYNPGQWMTLLAACVGGTVATALLMQVFQKAKKLHYVAKNAGLPDLAHPLPRRVLSWKQQDRQANALAAQVRDHTGIEVPTLSTTRLFVALGISFVFLAGLVWLAWATGSPWALAAWPGGVLLFVYLFEIHPRVVTAHVLLRHTFEETLSTWVDPHRPFQPKGAKDCTGEFLISSPEELPVRWALRPVPYGTTRQGVLNSLQQTLNRHWDCHHFYHDLHIVRDIDIPMPGGFRFMTGLTIALVVLGVALAGYVQYTQRTVTRDYDDNLKIGYNLLLAGEPNKAVEYFDSAVRQRGSAVAPHLYLAHAHAASGNSGEAEQSFTRAVNRKAQVPAAYNDFGNFLQREGRLADAVERYRRALELEPDNENVLNNLGSALYKLRDYPAAITELSRTVAIKPNHNRAWTTLGLCHEAMGSMEKAKQNFEKAIEVAPNFPYTQLARDRIAAGLAADEGTLALDVTAAAATGTAEGEAGS